MIDKNSDTMLFFKTSEFVNTPLTIISFILSGGFVFYETFFLKTLSTAFFIASVFIIPIFIISSLILLLKLSNKKLARACLENNRDKVASEEYFLVALVLSTFGLWSIINTENDYWYIFLAIPSVVIVFFGLAAIIDYVDEKEVNLKLLDSKKSTKISNYNSDNTALVIEHLESLSEFAWRYNINDFGSINEFKQLLNVHSKINFSIQLNKCIPALIELNNIGDKIEAREVAQAEELFRLISLANKDFNEQQNKTKDDEFEDRNELIKRISSDLERKD